MEVLYVPFSSAIFTNGSSAVTFSHNNADHGGAVFAQDGSPITFLGSSTVKFNNNYALWSGGAIYAQYGSPITFHKNSMVMFSRNHARNGGAIAFLNTGIYHRGTDYSLFKSLPLNAINFKGNLKIDIFL